MASVESGVVKKPVHTAVLHNHYWPSLFSGFPWPFTWSVSRSRHKTHLSPFPICHVCHALIPSELWPWLCCVQGQVKASLSIGLSASAKLNETAIHLPANLPLFILSQGENTQSCWGLWLNNFFTFIYWPSSHQVMYLRVHYSYATMTRGKVAVEGEQRCWVKGKGCTGDERWSSWELFRYMSDKWCL